MRFARIAEIVLGLWLVASPALVAGPVDVPGGVLPVGVLVVAVAALALVPFLERFYLHLLNGVAGIWLTGWIFLADRPVSAAGQNGLLVGLVLMMLAIVPTRAVSPPRGWRAYLAESVDQSTIE